MKKHPLWNPTYTITPTIASALMEIEAARAVVEHIPLSLAQNLLKQWLKIADSSRRVRNYILSAIYRQYIGSLSAINNEESK